MKAIHQLIAYLRSRGVLAARQCAELERRGFLPPEAQPEAEEYEADVLPPDSLLNRRRVPMDAEEAAEETPRRKKAGGRTVVHKGPVLDDDGLLNALRAAMPAWPEKLKSFTRFAVQLGSRGDWREAALAIRAADDAALEAAVLESFQRRTPAFGALWDALEMDDYRAVVSGTRGAVVNAYNALLAAQGATPANRYRWLLKYDDVAAVGNLHSAQNRVFRAFGRALEKSPEALARALDRDSHARAYWPMALVYSARRGRKNHRPSPLPTERHPVRAAPDEQDWEPAWECAIRIEPRTAFFLAETHAPLSHDLFRIAARILENAKDDLIVDNKDLDYAYDLNCAETRPSAERFCNTMAEALVREFSRAGIAYFNLNYPAPAQHVADVWLRANYDQRHAVLDGAFKMAHIFCPRTWDTNHWQEKDWARSEF